MMREPSTSGRARSPAAAPSIAVLAIGLAAILLAPPGLSAAESPPTRLVRCSQDVAETKLTLMYQLPGSMPLGVGIYAKAYTEGDELRPAGGASSATDAMGTKTSTQAEFEETEVTFTITQVPGPDRLNPYKVVIHAPFRQNVSGTVDGTKYDATWSDAPAGKTFAPDVGPPRSLMVPPPVVLAGPIISSVPISAAELMMLPHDPRLTFDVEHDSESGSGDWIRFQARGPANEISQVFRIQTLSDPGGGLGTAGVAESEVKAVCAPYLPNSLERQCKVQVLKRASGDIYYCLLTSPATAGNPKPPAGQFRNLFVGVFRVGTAVAFVVGNFNQTDDVGFRMMMEMLEKASTLPIVTASYMPAAAGNRDNPLWQ
jgi:hypothetical protein